MAMPSFVGRSTELDQIKACWTKAREGQPQVINLIADTGVGKTRLVQAFYEWLSTDPDQGDGLGTQGYWPDDLGLGRQRVVNPPLERFSAFDLKKNRIPWLWWGMYWTDADGENEAGLTRFHAALECHLDMLELERKFRLSSLNALGDFLKEEGLSQAGEFIPGASQAVNVYNLAKNMVANRKTQRDMQKGLGSQTQRQQDELADSIMARLEIVFNPKKKDVPRVPLVLFLDDIHFATDISEDGFTLQFLDRLLRQAALKEWPLLVITTHWKAPWMAHREGVTLTEGKPWRRVVSELDSANATPSPDFHSLELNKVPDNDLRMIISDLQPSLSRENQDSILDAVDNVRWLVEVLNALGDSIENYEGNDRERPLSAHGQRRLKELLKSRGYLEVIRQRLEGDAMTGVRAVLGAVAWHAYGLEFLSPLARSFGPGLLEQGSLTQSGGEPEQQVLDLLLRAVDPGALLEGQSAERSLPSIVRFPERGYLDTAKDMFNPDMLSTLRVALGQEIINWMQSQEGTIPRWQQLESTKDQKAFLEIARVVLGQLTPQLNEEQRTELSNTEERLRKRLEKGKISEEELQVELQELENELLEEADEALLPAADYWAVVATGELIYILKDEGEARAFNLAFELANTAQITEVLTHFNLPTVLALTELWKEKTDCHEQARTTLASLINRLDGDVELEPTADRLQDLANALLRFAELSNVGGNTDQAREDFQRSLEISERLLDKFGKTPERLWDITNLLVCLAYLDQEAGDTNKARVGFQRSLEIGERLVAEFGETPERMRSIIVPSVCMADLDKEAGDTNKARAVFQRCLESSERLLAEFGETPERLRAITISLERLADLDQEAGDTDKARAGFQRSLEIGERLLAEFGETPERLRTISVSLVSLADLGAKAGDTDKARTGFQRSLEIDERLLAEFGETPERLHDITVSLERLADLDKEAGDTDKARAGFQRSLEIGERLLAEFNETPERLRAITVPLERLADLDRAAGNTEQARAACQRSLEIGERLLAEFGETPGRLRAITVSLERLADLDKAVGNTAQARAALQRSIKICEELLKKSETPERFRDLIVPLLRLADLDQEENEIDKALDSYTYAANTIHHELTKFGASPQRLRDLTKLILFIAELKHTSGDFEEARRFYQKTLDITKNLTDAGIQNEFLFTTDEIVKKRLSELE